MTTAPAASRPRYSHIGGCEANAYGVAPAFLHAIPADAADTSEQIENATRPSVHNVHTFSAEPLMPAGWTASAEQGGSDHDRDGQ